MSTSSSNLVSEQLTAQIDLAETRLAAFGASLADADPAAGERLRAIDRAIGAIGGSAP